jgi:hypothetical protein
MPDNEDKNGADRDRTDDLYVANVPLSQLSYCPIFSFGPLIYGIPTENQAISTGGSTRLLLYRAVNIPPRIRIPPI